MDAKVTWQQRMSFTGSAETGFNVPLGSEASVGGDEDDFRPIELIVTGLAGCTAMDVISVLQKKRQQVTAFEVQVHAERAEEHPKVITRAVIEYFVSGHAVEEAAVVRSIELSATRYCPGIAMFRQVFPMSFIYHIFEDEEDGRRSLVLDGEYVMPVAV